MADLTGDPRIEAYARLLVERCLDVQPGWEVLIRSTPLARPLLEELERQIGRRGAHAIMRINWSLWPVDERWAAEAPEDLLSELPEVDRYACDRMDARMTLDAPESTRSEADLPADRLERMNTAEKVFYRRTMTSEIPWVSCQFPTNALAQEAGLTLDQLTEILFDACLLDWDAEGERMRRYADRFDTAHEIRIVGEGTDLTLSLDGRHGEVDDGRKNMPGGEFFFAPVESSAGGVVTFSEYPAVYGGHELEGIRLEFADGKVVGASASRGQEVLERILDRDEGARRIGELGIGCNPGITRYMNNVLFDEKIDGSIHLALGQSYTSIGGENTSSIHWDIVKDLRSGGRIELDGDVVQENGAWRV
ncbi:MAG TPA: aminopeptidase [Gaiellaceae bacterium]|nr:aminopeptidase [Gaiellaceae bacterium]